MLAGLRQLWLQRDLVAQFARRDLAQRHRGSLGGVAWVLLQPALLLVLYTFVFVEIFQVRWFPEQAGRTNPFDFALMAFAGMSLHAMLADCATRAVGLIVGNPNFVKKQRFPLEAIGLALAGASFVQYLAALGLLVVFSLFVYGMPPVTALLIPLYLLPFGILCVAMIWLLSSLGVYLRDLGQLVGMVMTALFFLSPILYPVEFVPEAYRVFIQLNPLTFPVEAVRSLLFHGVLPDPWAFLVYSLLSFGLLALSVFVFNRLKHGFADVL